MVGKALFARSLHQKIKGSCENISLGGLWTGKKKYSGMSTALLDFKAPFKGDFVKDASLFIVYMPFGKALRWLKSSESFLKGKIVIVIGAPFVSEFLKRDNICNDVCVVEADIPFSGYAPDKKFILPDEIHCCVDNLLVQEQRKKIDLFFLNLSCHIVWKDADMFEQELLEKSIVPRLVCAETIMRLRRIKKDKRQPIVLPEQLFTDNISVDMLFMKKDKIIPLLKRQEVLPQKTIRALSHGHKKLLFAVCKNRNLKL